MLTMAQQKTYQFIKRFVKKHAHSPTIAEIAEGINISSRGVVHRYVQALVAEGLLELSPNRRRNIKLVEPDDKQLLLIGNIAAGKPIEAIPENQAVNLAEILLGESRFALKVKGNSMIEEGIFDGDIVVCEKRDRVSNGDIVVALIDNDTATLKRLRRNPDNTISLLPANSRLLPMVYEAERVQIQGVYIGLVRFEK